MNPELPSTTLATDDLAERLKALIMAEGEPEDVPIVEPVEETEESDEEEETVVLAEEVEEESDYEDEGEALTQALRILVMQE